jgi:hypothetical protein
MREEAVDSRFAATIAALIARCRLHQDDLVGAESWLKNASTDAQHIDHANVLALIDEVRNDIDRMHGTVVLRLDNVGTYEESERRLRTFLVDVCRKQGLSPAAAAKRLNIGESSYYKWSKLADEADA